MKLEVCPGPVVQANEARYLLVPRPPGTSWQSFVGLESSLCCAQEWLTAENALQEAWLFRAPADGEARFVFHFNDRLPVSAGSEPLFPKVLSPLTAPSPELAAKVSEITCACADDAARLEALIAFTASLFDYDHPERPFNHGMERMPLLTQLTRGNCADIHGFLLSCLYAAGMDASYMAGFYFPQQDTRTRGYHCWLASRCGGDVSYWDVAQHLKADIRPVGPGLDPVGGQRIAMSIGRGLVFAIDGQRIQLPHFGHPMWIYADGMASGLGTTARILPGNETPATKQLIEEIA